MGPYDQQFSQSGQKGAKSIFDNKYWTGRGQSYGEAAMGGVSAGMAVPPAEDRFSIDPNAGYKGSFSGLTQGGVIGAIAGGITAQAGTFSRVNKNLKSLNTSVDSFSSDGYNAPEYNSGAFINATQNLNDIKAGQKAISNSKDPATFGFSAAFGTKRKLREAEGRVRRGIEKGQSDFNEANKTYQQSQLSRRAYEDQINNIYGIPRGYY